LQVDHDQGSFWVKSGDGHNEVALCVVLWNRVSAAGRDLRKKGPPVSCRPGD
jgi:hypothetical protein